MTDAPNDAGLVALADRPELWPIDRLRPYDRNPRTHSDTQVDQIAASVIEFGWTNPVLVDEQGGKQAVDQQFARWVMLHVQSNPLPICTRPRVLIKGKRTLLTAFQGAVDATFVAFGIDAVYTPAGGEPVSVRVIARRPDTIVGFGETRIHAETATFEVRASEIASPAPGGSAYRRRRHHRYPGRAGAARS